MSNDSCKLYESGALSGFLGESFHPGGLELTERALRDSDLPRQARILDIGCGSGETVFWLVGHNHKAEGIDSSSKLISKGLENNPGLPIKEGFSESLPYDDGIFDGVLLECTLSLFEDSDQSLEEINRVLKRNGKLIVSDFYLLAGAESLSLPLVTCLNGVEKKEAIIKRMAIKGFSLLKFCDQNYYYKKMIFDIIMEYGSLDNFWSSLNREKEQCFCDSLKGKKLSYFYAVFQKEETGND